MSVHRSLIPLALLVGATVVALGCRDVSPVGVAALTPAGTATFHKSSDGDGDAEPSDTTDADDPDADSLVACRPLPYDSVTQTIGPQGGEVEVGASPRSRHPTPWR